jgi:predicted transcriptional regulator
MNAPPLHELESEVMEELWRVGEAPVRQVMDALNRTAERSRAYTTYMTVMARLHGKGLLERRRDGRTDIYTPVWSRAEYVSLRAESEVEELINRYGDVAFSHFAKRVAGLDPERRRALERLSIES